MASRIPRLSPKSQEALVQYCRGILEVHKHRDELCYKLETIDKAYFRYKAAKGSTESGRDAPAADVQCGINADDLVVPVTVSQVDSYVGYLADIFLTGYPLFPVVGNPDSQKETEALQTIIEDHSIRGRYVRQILMNLYDGIKYNYTAAEIDWCPIDSYSVPSALDQMKDAVPESNAFSINKLLRIDPYNLIADPRVAPSDVPYQGEWAGKVEVISQVELARRLDYAKRSDAGYNLRKALESPVVGAQGSYHSFNNYYAAPQVSNTLSRPSDLHHGVNTNWAAWLGADEHKQTRVKFIGAMYEYITLYVRIVPTLYGMNVPDSWRPQVWKLCIVNGEILVYAARIYTVYDILPIIISQPREDGFRLQTVSVGEGATDFQRIASQLLAIRLNAARRAIMDRAIYDPGLINPSHLNAPIPAAKIPIRDSSQMAGRTLTEAYMSIPFDSRGTETVVQDLATVLRLGDQLNGTNQPAQGQFQRGNKTRREWVDTMEGAYNRLRLPALNMEYNFFLPIKEQIKLNIYQYGVEGIFQNPGNGEVYNVDSAMLEQIKRKVNAFKIADGFHPAEKLAGTDVLQAGMQMIDSSPVLQATLGPLLPKIWAHLMSVGGVTGLSAIIESIAANGSQQAPAPASAG